MCVSVVKHFLCVWESVRVREISNQQVDHVISFFVISFFVVVVVVANVMISALGE